MTFLLNERNPELSAWHLLIWNTPTVTFVRAWWRRCTQWWWNQCCHLRLTEWDLVEKVIFIASGEEQKEKNLNLIILIWVTLFVLVWFHVVNCYVLVLQFISVSCSFSCSRKCLEITTAIEITAGCSFQGNWKERDKEVWLLKVTDFCCLHSTQEHKTLWQH